MGLIRESPQLGGGICSAVLLRAMHSPALPAMASLGLV